MSIVNDKTGAVLDQAVEPSKQTALLAAAMHGRVDCVKLMVAHKADLAATDENGATALDYADEHEEVACCCQLRCE